MVQEDTEMDDMKRQAVMIHRRKIRTLGRQAEWLNEAEGQRKLKN